jgi:hypothetical protein
MWYLLVFDLDIEVEKRERLQKLFWYASFFSDSILIILGGAWAFAVLMAPRTFSIYYLVMILSWCVIKSLHGFLVSRSEHNRVREQVRWTLAILYLCWMAVVMGISLPAYRFEVPFEVPDAYCFVLWLYEVFSNVVMGVLLTVDAGAPRVRNDYLSL